MLKQCESIGHSLVENTTLVKDQHSCVGISLIGSFANLGKSVAKKVN